MCGVILEKVSIQTFLLTRTDKTEGTVEIRFVNIMEYWFILRLYLLVDAENEDQESRWRTYYELADFEKTLDDGLPSVSGPDLEVVDLTSLLLGTGLVS